MIKHKKILKNFNFPKMVDKARRDHPDLNKRIARFKWWKNVIKFWRCDGFEDKLTWNKEMFCFEFWDGFINESDSTQCEKKYIGDYFRKDEKWSRERITN